MALEDQWRRPSWLDDSLRGDRPAAGEFELATSLDVVQLASAMIIGAFRQDLVATPTPAGKDRQWPTTS